MNTTASGSAPTEAARIGSGGPWQWHRLRWTMLVGVVVFAVVAVVVDPFAKTPPVKGVVDNAGSSSALAVTQQDISSQTQELATLGYAGSYSVVNQAAGTLTAIPAVGQVVSQGQALYQVSGNPVVLLYGSTPAYRGLSEGVSASDVTGPDVQELNADLVALGVVTNSELDPNSDEFGYWTKVGVEKLQATLGVTQNGTLALGQAVFLPGAVRVTIVSEVLGGPAQAGQAIISGTSTTREVMINLDAAQQSQVKAGDQVTITLPDGGTTPGVISLVGTVATTPPSSQSGGNNASTPTITVLVQPTEPAATGTWDQAPVNVTITTGSVSNVLVVPVDALLAKAGGGYAVEVVGTGGIHHLVPVTLGIFDDAQGMVQVSGSGLAAGQRVVVPAL
jgi:hypothetical protein